MPTEKNNDWDDLYDAYVRYMRNAHASILPLQPNDYCRELFAAAFRVLHRPEFDSYLEKLGRVPGAKAAFVQNVRRGFKPDGSEALRTRYRTEIVSAACSDIGQEEFEHVQQAVGAAFSEPPPYRNAG